MTDTNTTADGPAIVDKVIYKSKTVWGLVIGLLPLIAAAVGMDAPADLGALSQAGLDFINSINELVGVGLIIWGRYTAPGVRLTFS